MRKWITAILMAIMLSIGIAVQAQTNGLGTFSVMNTRYAVNKKWLIWNELQLRSNRFYNHFFYSEIKGGAQYSLTDAFSYLMGIGRYRTYTPGGNFKSPLTADEFRLWEQFTLTNNVSRVKIEHRYRIEQRWFTTGYRNRFRYRISMVLPLGKPKMEPHTFFLTGFEELFLTNKAPHFERNRLLAGVGYQFSKVLSLQSGYCNQYDYRANGSSVNNHFLQTTLFFNFKHADVVREFHPSPMD